MRKINQLERGVKSASIPTINIPKPQMITLGANRQLHTFRADGINAVKLEIIFEAGRIIEDKKMVAQACGALLTEGSAEYDSARISEMVDYEGAHLSSHSGTDFLCIKIVSAKRSFSKMLNLLSSILKKPRFDKNELLLFVKRKKQQLAIDLSKNDVIAYRTITENLYGVHTPYGYNSSAEYLHEVKPEDLKAHYNKYCIKENAHIFLSGDFEEKHLSKIDKLFQVLPDGPIRNKPYRVVKTKRQDIEKKGREIQASLKLGLRIFDRTHKDYPGLYFLNVILGGYFGSRLMKNIREEKGYTYNIYSVLDIYKYDGNLIISSELNSSNVQNTMDEIDKEFNRLRQTPINDDELNMVKNYLMGNFMSTINGPFKAINPYKTTRIMGLEMDYYESFFRSIKNLSKDDILSLSNEYLHIGKFWKVIVGKG